MYFLYRYTAIFSINQIWTGVAPLLVSSAVRGCLRRSRSRLPALIELSHDHMNHFHVDFITTDFYQMGLTVTKCSACTFFLFFSCDNPKGTRVHKSNSRITAREWAGVPVKLKESGKDQSKVERPAGSAAFWLALSANRLNQGEEVRCPTLWVVMMGNA